MARTWAHKGIILARFLLVIAIAVIILLAILTPTVQRKRQRLSSAEQRFQRFILQLREGDESHRAAVKLGQSGDPRALSVLMTAIKDESFSVRRVAATGLGHVRDSRATETLLKALRDNRFVQNAAARSLRRLKDPEAVDPLLDMLKDPSPDVRSHAVWVLSAYRDPRTVEPLYAALKDPDPSVRTWAVREVGKFADSRAVDALVAALPTGAGYLASMPEGRGIGALLNALDHSDRVVREAALSALQRYPKNSNKDALVHGLLQKLEQGRGEFRWMAVSALGSIDDARAFEAVLEAVTDKDHTVRRAALHVLGRVKHDRAFAVMAALALDDSSDLQQLAVYFLMLQKDPRTIDIMLHCLKHKEATTRWRAAHALGSFGDPRVIDPLATAARSDNATRVRREAVESLGRIFHPRATEALASILDSSNELEREVRRVAAAKLAQAGDTRALEWLLEDLKKDSKASGYWKNILSNIRDPRVAEVLMEDLKDANVNVRSVAVTALGGFDDPRVVDALTTALEDKDKSVRERAAISLGKTKSVKAVPALIRALEHQDPFVRRRAAQSLGATKSVKAVPALIRALEDAMTTEPAAEVLGRIGDRRAVRPLLVVLRGRHFLFRRPNARDRFEQTAAAEALGCIGDRQAIPHLVAALGSPSVMLATSAAEALGELKSIEAVDALIETLEYDHCAVRNAAARSLGEIGNSRAVEPLAARLSDYLVRATATSSLLQLGWRPRTSSERVYFSLAQNLWNDVAANWSLSREVLAKDLVSNDQDELEGAAYTFIAMGTEDAIGSLEEVLRLRGTYRMARMFRSCGQPQLQSAAMQWALEEGMDPLPELNPETIWLRWGEHNLDRLQCSALYGFE